MIHPLVEWGWNGGLAARFEPHCASGLVPGRVVAVFQELARVVTADGESLATVTGKFRFEARGPGDYPAVGDWVAVQPADRPLIHVVLPRDSAFTRKAAGGPAAEQVVASNVTTVFLVTALNGDFNLRRLERYLALAWESGARPVVVLSKADLSESPAARSAQVAAIAPGVPVLAISTLAGSGLDALAPHLGPGETVALLGSSGAGKSTLLNHLARGESRIEGGADRAGGERARTQAVREGDDRARHTTTHRELVRLPTGGVLIDTPGMREVGLWGDEGGLDAAFEYVEALRVRCRFRDCAHDREPGCAVRAALDDGALDAGRYESYLKLKREAAHLARKTDQRAALAEKARWKQIHQAQKQHYKG